MDSFGSDADDLDVALFPQGTVRRLRHQHLLCGDSGLRLHSLDNAQPQGCRPPGTADHASARRSRRFLPCGHRAAMVADMVCAGTFHRQHRAGGRRLHDGAEHRGAVDDGAQVCRAVAGVADSGRRVCRALHLQGHIPLRLALCGLYGNRRLRLPQVVAADEGLIIMDVWSV